VPLDDAEELILVRVILAIIAVFSAIATMQALSACIFAAILVISAGQGEQRGHEGLLHAGEGEAVSDAGDGAAEVFGELDGGAFLELAMPVLTVQDAEVLRV